MFRGNDSGACRLSFCIAPSAINSSTITGRCTRSWVNGLRVRARMPGSRTRPKSCCPRGRIAPAARRAGVRKPIFWMCGSIPAPRIWPCSILRIRQTRNFSGRRICTSRDRISIAAGFTAHFWSASRCATVHRTAKCSRTAGRLTPRASPCRSRSAISCCQLKFARSGARTCCGCGLRLRITPPTCGCPTT